MGTGFVIFWVYFMFLRVTLCCVNWSCFWFNNVVLCKIFIVVVCKFTAVCIICLLACLFWLLVFLFDYPYGNFSERTMVLPLIARSLVRKE